MISVVVMRFRGDKGPGALQVTTILATAAPLGYYALLSRFDPTWALSGRIKLNCRSGSVHNLGDRSTRAPGVGCLPPATRHLPSGGLADLARRGAWTLLVHYPRSLWYLSVTCFPGCEYSVRRSRCTGNERHALALRNFVLLLRSAIVVRLLTVRCEESQRIPLHGRSDRLWASAVLHHCHRARCH